MQIGDVALVADLTFEGRPLTAEMFVTAAGEVQLGPSDVIDGIGAHVSVSAATFLDTEIVSIAGGDHTTRAALAAVLRDEVVPALMSRLLTSEHDVELASLDISTLLSGFLPDLALETDLFVEIRDALRVLGNTVLSGVAWLPAPTQ